MLMKFLHIFILLVIPKVLLAEINVSDSIYGDFNGDGKKEYVWNETVSTDSFPSCIIRSSDKTVPPVFLNRECYGGHLILEGDLNGDGTDEFSFLEHGDASEWLFCSVFTLRNGNWSNPIRGFTVYSSNHEDLVNKDKSNSGYVIIVRSEMTDAGVVFHEESVQFK